MEKSYFKEPTLMSEEKINEKYDQVRATVDEKIMLGEKAIELVISLRRGRGSLG